MYFTDKWGLFGFIKKSIQTKNARKNIVIELIPVKLSTVFNFTNML